jgi:hypothetical protein
VFKGTFKDVAFQKLNQRLFYQIDTINPYKLLEEKDLK